MLGLLNDLLIDSMRKRRLNVILTSCVLQQGLLALSGSLVVALLVAEAVCASNNDAIKTKLLSSTLFMNGVTTLLQVILGIR